MSIKRTLSTILGLPIVIAIVILGNNITIDIIFSIIALISMNEFLRAVSKEYKPVKTLGYILCIGIAFIHIIPTDLIKLITILIIPIVMAILFLKAIISDLDTDIKDLSITLFGICYIVGFIVFIPLINGLENGKLILGYLIAVSWGTDIFAYIVGNIYGKHKFSKISPKKSIEGCIGGVLGSIIIVLIYRYFVTQFSNLEISYLFIGIITLILSIVSQIGDFSASAIKRCVNIKDYGNLIPGHGGILDRFDSLMFIAPFVYAVFILMK